jgi:hypothetical protein
MEALLPGTLVAHPDSGIGVRFIGDGSVYEVRWPHGWTGRRFGERVVLLDEHRRIVAREGDTVEVGGGESAGEWMACGGVEVVERAL